MTLKQKIAKLFDISEFAKGMRFGIYLGIYVMALVWGIIDTLERR